MNIRLPVASILPLLACVCFPVVASAQKPAGDQAGVLAATTAFREESAQFSEYVRRVFQGRDGDL